jgi:hypothetical protein
MARHHQWFRTALPVLAGAVFGAALVVCGNGGPGPGSADMGGGPMGGPSRVITADQDPARIETGVVDSYPLQCSSRLSRSSTCARVLDGPFVLTDLRLISLNPLSFGAVNAFVAESDDQIFPMMFRPRWQTALAIQDKPSAPFIPLLSSGMRLLVKANEKLYISGSADNMAAQVLWSGFRPY